MTAMTETGYLPPEPQEGNTEYKLKLIDPTAERFVHLVTQMKWRLAEGFGEAVYQIGVADDGHMTGLSKEELEESLQTLSAMANANGATISFVLKRPGFDGTSLTAEVHVRRVPDDAQFIDVRVLLIGGGGSGKSTLLGVLTTGDCDNGRGRARLHTFKHNHEIISGRTASINREVLGFDGDGQVTNYDGDGSRIPMPEICNKSSKIIDFVDSPGHSKFHRTTIKAMASRRLDYAAFVVSGVSVPSSDFKEYLEIAVNLHIRPFVVVSKVDACSKKELRSCLEKVLSTIKSPSVKKIPFIVKSRDDACTAVQSMADGIVPILLVSSVTLKNIDLLKFFLNLLPPTKRDSDVQWAKQAAVAMSIEDVFNVTDVGAVVYGRLVSGSICAGDALRLGPLDDGSFVDVEVKDIHRNRIPYRVVKAGQAASIALDCDFESLRPGQILTSRHVSITCSLEFDADVYLLNTSDPVCVGQQVSVFVGTVKQTASIISLEPPLKQQGDRAKARFKFISRPEHLIVGSSFVIRGGGSKAIGRITGIEPYYIEEPCTDMSGSLTSIESDDSEASQVGSPPQ